MHRFGALCPVLWVLLVAGCQGQPRLLVLDLVGIPGQAESLELAMGWSGREPQPLPLIEPAGRVDLRVALSLPEEEAAEVHVAARALDAAGCTLGVGSKAVVSGGGQPPQEVSFRLTALVAPDCRKEEQVRLYALLGTAGCAGQQAVILGWGFPPMGLRAAVVDQMSSQISWRSRGEIGVFVPRVPGLPAGRVSLRVWPGDAPARGDMIALDYRICP